MIVTLSINEPWDFEGPAGINQLLVEVDDPFVSFPREFAGRVNHPFVFDGLQVEQLHFSARHKEHDGHYNIAVIQQNGEKQFKFIGSVKSCN